MSPGRPLSDRASRVAFGSGSLWNLPFASQCRSLDSVGDFDDAQAVFGGDGRFGAVGRRVDKRLEFLFQRVAALDDRSFDEALVAVVDVAVLLDVLGEGLAVNFDGLADEVGVDATLAGGNGQRPNFLLCEPAGGQFANRAVVEGELCRDVLVCRGRRRQVGDLFNEQRQQQVDVVYHQVVDDAVCDRTVDWWPESLDVDRDDV